MIWVARVSAVVFLLGAVGGMVFSGLSTADFVQHLDRQVHAIHCSFVPGAAPTTDAATGCHVALMSSWSSVFRSWIWGGLPIALPGLALFAFLVFRGVETWVVRGLRDKHAALFLFVFTLLPVATSVFYAGVAILELDAFCRTCAGIYTSSAIAFAGALGMLVAAFWPQSRPDPDDEAIPSEGGSAPGSPHLPEGDEPPPAPPTSFEHPAALWAIGAAESVVFLLVPIGLYVLAMPDHGRYIGACGSLAKPEDPSQVLVPIGRHRGTRKAIEVFDPLCPACKGFEERLVSSGIDEALDREALLFPLDDQCNWMVSSAIHPGACTVSEAVLCAEGRAQDVIDWAFAHQEEIRTAAAADPNNAEKMVEQAFPALARCVGSPGARQKLNRSLRWAVANELPVLTPQLYVGGVKLCDEDTDLGMEFALSRLVARSR